MSGLNLESRLHLKELNVRALQTQKCISLKYFVLFNYDFLADSELSNRDSALKKNSTFVKKLRALPVDNGEGLKSEFSKLRLTKYVNEAVGCLLENRLKSGAEILLFLELCTLFNCTYSEFGPELLQVLEVSIDQLKEKAHDLSPDDLLKLRSLLRALAELTLIKVVNDSTVLSEKIRFFLTVDEKTSHKFVPLVNYLLKVLKPFYIEGEGSFISSEVSFKFSEVFSSFFKSMSRLLVRAHGKLQAIESRGKFHYENRGDLSEKQTEVWSDTKNFYETLKGNLEVLATILGADLPQLEENQDAPKVIEGKIVFADFSIRNSEFAHQVFDTEEDRVFYESIISLGDLVPSDILPKTSGKVDSSDADAGYSGPSIDPDTCFSDLKEHDLSSRDNNSFDSLIANIQSMHSSAMADKVAVDFCFVANKSRVKQLPEILLEISRSRSDLIPFIGRVLAALKPFYPEIIKAACSSLTGQFFFLAHKTDPIRATRARICRFIGELTKFKVMDQGLVFSCLKKVVENFNHYNVDMACMLIENCGRFLSVQPESCVRMQNLVEIVARKKVSGDLDQNRIIMIENALYLMKPPQHVVQQRKERSSMEKFIRKLIRTDLNADNSMPVFELVRKLNWTDPIVRRSMMSCMLKCWKVKESSIPMVAAIVGGMQRLYPDFITDLVDNLLEEFHSGLRHNVPIWNHRRISVVKLLSELYVYSVIDADVILYCMSLLLTYGHPFGIARISFPVAVDPPTSTFRIRLACIMLQHVGSYLAKGPLKVVFDQFLIGFQYYIFTKSPLDLETENLIEETLELLETTFEIGSIQAAIKSIASLHSQLSFLLEDLGADASRNASRVHSDVEEADETFDVEFDQLLSSTIEQSVQMRKLDKRPQLFDAPLPVSGSARATSEDTMAFKLLLKKKNRPQVKVLNVPVHQKFVENVLEEQSAQENRAQALKEKTLERHAAASDEPFDNSALLTALKQIAPPTRADFQRLTSRRRFLRSKYK